MTGVKDQTVCQRSMVDYYSHVYFMTVIETHANPQMHSAGQQLVNNYSFFLRAEIKLNL